MKRYKLYTTVGIIETDDNNDKYKYVLHREDGPAYISYNTDGSIEWEFWYINGVLHREDGPAYIRYNKDGSIRYEEWYINGVLHRGDGPAHITYTVDGDIYHEEWCINGVLHREDAPAYIIYNDDSSIFLESWWWCGMQHRHDYTKPAQIYGDVTHYYYWYGVRCKPKQLLNQAFRDRIQLEKLG
jgi:hypothetical protein